MLFTQGGGSLPLATATSRSTNAVSGRQAKQKRLSPRMLAYRIAYTPLLTPPLRLSSGSGRHLKRRTVTLSLTQGLFRNRIPVFKTSHFRHLFRFVVSSATPSAGDTPATPPEYQGRSCWHKKLRVPAGNSNHKCSLCLSPPC